MSRIESDVWNGSDTSVPSDAVFHQYTDFEMDNILRDGTIGTIDLADKSSKVWI